MKYIHKKGFDAVNLDKVTSIALSVRSESFFINFYFDSVDGDLTARSSWAFGSKEERDRVHHSILGICECVIF